MKLARRVTHVIYDLDGVLLDTEHIYTEVTQEIVAVFGKRFDWSLKSNMIGRPSIESARFLVESLDLPISPEEYLTMRRGRLEERFAATPAKPGAESFTRGLSALGVGQAIATSSERDLYRRKIDMHRAWFEIFSAAITGDDERVERGKPAPDIFRVAASALGAIPGECLVFEDAPAGVEAARAAGMQVVAMPDPALDRARVAAADIVIDGFGELSPEDLGF